MHLPRRSTDVALRSATGFTGMRRAAGRVRIREPPARSDHGDHLREVSDGISHRLREAGERVVDSSTRALIPGG